MLQHLYLSLRIGCGRVQKTLWKQASSSGAGERQLKQFSVKTEIHFVLVYSRIDRDRVRPGGVLMM
uniref:Uncharacterized protein n=1 Tax=Anguilla anguilla TaxID=7936 RepID=A0A0E9UEG5_ANGAN